jgi:uncharacterized YigZ family protein
MEEQASDRYLTIYKQSEGIYKEKGSKFIARVFHVEDEDRCKEIIKAVRKEYYDARHHCYAYRLGPEDGRYRSSDDGEPSGSAGKPILNQIYSSKLYYVLIVVIRYFGGTKLGVSGLIQAYKRSSRDAIENAQIAERYLTKAFSLSFSYPDLNNVMRILKDEKPDILKQDFSELCVINIDVRKNNVQRTLLRLKKIRSLQIKTL